MHCPDSANGDRVWLSCTCTWSTGKGRGFFSFLSSVTSFLLTAWRWPRLLWGHHLVMSLLRLFEINTRTTQKVVLWVKWVFEARRMNHTTKLSLTVGVRGLTGKGTEGVQYLVGLVHVGKLQHTNHKPTCMSSDAFQWELLHSGGTLKKVLLWSEYRFWTETDKLKGKHVGNMLSGRWGRSSVSAAATALH